jgi:hypothetical protein
MTFKNLNIDRSQIDETIKTWADLKEDIAPQKKGSAYHYSLLKEDCEVKLVVYYKKDGTTTIDPTSGKNTEKSIELTTYILDNCLITKKKNFTLSFKNVPNEDLSLLVEYLVDEHQATILEEDDTSAHRILKIKGQYGDLVTITYYENNTVLIQGKPLNLYNEIKLFFYEILSFEEILSKESETYKVDIKPDDIRNELEAYLPSAYPFMQEKIRKIISPSLLMIKLEVSVEDYSLFLYPILRGIEGYIRQILVFKGKEPGVKCVGKIGSLFRKNENNYFELMSFAKDDIGCDATCESIARLYNFFTIHRHSLFHVESGKKIQLTRTICKKESSEALIHEALNLIEDTYRKMPKS